MTLASKVSVKTHEVHAAVGADRGHALTVDRLPVRRTTGVNPWHTAATSPRVRQVTSAATTRRRSRLVRRRRQLLCVPDQFTHAAINDAQCLSVRRSRPKCRRRARSGWRRSSPATSRSRRRPRRACCADRTSRSGLIQHSETLITWVAVTLMTRRLARKRATPSWPRKPAPADG